MLQMLCFLLKVFTHFGRKYFTIPGVESKIIPFTKKKKVNRRRFSLVPLNRMNKQVCFIKGLITEWELITANFCSIVVTTFVDFWVLKLYNYQRCTVIKLECRFWQWTSFVKVSLSRNAVLLLRKFHGEKSNQKVAVSEPQLFCILCNMCNSYFIQIFPNVSLLFFSCYLLSQITKLPDSVQSSCQMPAPGFCVLKA